MANEKYASNLLTDNLYKDINTLNTSSCWIWNGSLNSDGYGVGKRMINGKSYGFLIHRLSMYLIYGENIKNSVIDHTCHIPSECVNGIKCKHRRCFNPHHLRMTTTEENNKRGANRRDNVGICRNNLHEWNEENVTTWSSGKKVCMPCHQATMKRKKERRVAKLNG